MFTNEISRRNAIRLIAGAGATAGVAVAGRGSFTAIAQTVQNIQTVNTDLLNLRAGAGLSFDVIDTLPLGTQVAIDAAQRQAVDGVNWIFVTVVSGGTTGWVDSGYLGLSTPGTPATALGTKWVSVADANLRSGAGFSFDIIAMLPIGEAASITGDSTSADGLSWFPVTAAGMSGWLADIVLTDEQPSKFVQGASVSVNTDLLNLRKEAGTTSPTLFAYGFGTAATIVSESPKTIDSTNWHQVEITDDGKVGWFAEPFIAASVGGPSSEAVTVADGPLNLRMEPNIEAEIVTEIATGASATVIAPGSTANNGYQWLNVRLDDQTGREGWIASEFVSFV